MRVIFTFKIWFMDKRVYSVLEFLVTLVNVVNVNHSILSVFTFYDNLHTIRWRELCLFVCLFVGRLFTKLPVCSMTVFHVILYSQLPRRVYPIKYAHSFVVYCFTVFLLWVLRGLMRYIYIWVKSINSLWHNDAIWRHWTGLTLD